MTFIKITDLKQRKALARELHQPSAAYKPATYSIFRDLTQSGSLQDVQTCGWRSAKGSLKFHKNDWRSSCPSRSSHTTRNYRSTTITPHTDTVLGPRAQQYLQLSLTPYADHTFGLRSEENGIFIGSSPVTYEGDDIFGDGVRYKVTPDLWELMVK